MRALEELDVVVVPSTFPDNSPLVIHEALSAGIPVVASRIGGIPELVAGEVNGILCAPGDREGLRTALLRFVHDPLLRERLAAGAKICRHISDQAAEIRAVYDSLCT